MTSLTVSNVSDEERDVVDDTFKHILEPKSSKANLKEV